MSKSARIALLLAIMVVAVLLAPAFMSHIFGGLAGGFIAIGVGAVLFCVAAGMIVLSAAGILSAFIVGCIILLAVLSPVLVPVALFAGFIWLIVKLTSRRPAPPASPAPPATPAAAA